MGLMTRNAARSSDRVQAETLVVGKQRLFERGVSRHGSLQRELLLPGAWAKGDSVIGGRRVRRSECAGRVGGFRALSGGADKLPGLQRICRQVEPLPVSGVRVDAAL